MRTIRITGTGRLKVHPDMTSIAIKLSGICSDYKAAMEELTSYTGEIKRETSLRIISANNALTDIITVILCS